jgi:putative transposase
MPSVESLEKRNLLHVYNRGNRKTNIGLEWEDFVFLYDLITYSFAQSHFDLICLCIMPNHFHLLALQRGNCTISAVMQRIGIIYTKHFNKKYGHSGHLFQGKYKYKVIRHKLQLEIVFKYILKNPESIGLMGEKPWLRYNMFLKNYHFLNFPERSNSYRMLKFKRKP